MRISGPRTLAGQTLFILLLGLAASHAVGFAIYSRDRHDVVASTEAIDFAERVAGVIDLLQKLPNQWREELIRGSDSRVFRVSLGPSPIASIDDMEQGVVRDVIRILQEQFPEWPPERMLASLKEDHVSATALDFPVSMRNELRMPTNSYSPEEPSDLLYVSMGLEEDEWLNFTGAIPRIESSWPRLAGAYILTIAVGVGAVTIWLVARVTAPLRVFAAAADRFGKNIRAEPLPETGPVEVAKASQALNYMQERLSRLIDNRTQMLAAISHDLRTPVTFLRLRAELMTNAEERAKVLETLDDMESMITTVLDFSKGAFSEEQQRHVDLGALLESLCDDLSDTGAPIQFTPTPSQILYSCRRVALKRAFSNLIDNAIKYGQVARVAIEEQDKEIVVSIDDDGPGIAPENLAHIFTPFFRIEGSRSRRSGGVGLGLSIAQAIVEGHGGRISIENRTEGGARVRVALPR
ncbi:MAG TPA: ATP-binding protein [Gammaproteobacteria bacterium]|nr:ATP-binding protein [Gammaproteobacteria bacterium]